MVVAGVVGGAVAGAVGGAVAHRALTRLYTLLAREMLTPNCTCNVPYSQYIIPYGNRPME